MDLKQLILSEISKYNHLKIAFHNNFIDDLFNYYKINCINVLEFYLYSKIPVEHFIYYDDAIEYLAKYDSSLHESLSIIHEYGYFKYDDTKRDINSCMLANTLLYHKCQEELNDLFNNLKV